MHRATEDCVSSRVGKFGVVSVTYLGGPWGGDIRINHYPSSLPCVHRLTLDTQQSQ